MIAWYAFMPLNGLTGALLPPDEKVAMEIPTKPPFGPLQERPFELDATFLSERSIASLQFILSVLPTIVEFAICSKNKQIRHSNWRQRRNRTEKLNRLSFTFPELEKQSEKKHTAPSQIFLPTDVPLHLVRKQMEKFLIHSQLKYSRQQ